MANQLDELNPEIREDGLDTNVIAKKLPAEVGGGSKFFEIRLLISSSFNDFIGVLLSKVIFFKSLFV